MRIVLRKVTKTPLDFEVVSNEIAFKGYLEYHSAKLILLKAKISGTLEKSCDICAEDFDLMVNEDIEFFINDGIFEDDDSTLLDVVESLDGNVDIEELLRSEIELIKSDYHSCNNCRALVASAAQAK
ncbi:hypothetical protein [Sulfurimonas autotrophica]|uniref:DUF177 domain-containing protein n=1 Tax=Sulfurimonas autotrophica (strain ATCC BAA-671 / DSM 16294 / JCM 11897 / OK10) TaxID=563040 RepID=E0UP98_SULAO|nr:hypothetical protein [Sulfurimonas autotrophica]ADN08562.1 conserved hypothetical protein [Sulfurimonas autotrophica DSM 16294]